LAGAFQIWRAVQPRTLPKRRNWRICQGDVSKDLAIIQTILEDVGIEFVDSIGVQLWPLEARQAMRLEKQRGKSLVLKRTITLNGRATCVSLEDAFWAVLKEIAATKQRPVFDLIAEIDSKREHANLSSEIRLFVLKYYTATETKTNTRDQLRRHGTRPR
jgi:predicted DNA-binding ribbon-helix-helix protein